MQWIRAKGAVTTIRGGTKADRIWRQEDYSRSTRLTYPASRTRSPNTLAEDYLNVPHRPWTPVLTRSSIRATPKLGLKPKKKGRGPPSTLPHVLEHTDLHQIKCDPVEEREVVREDVL